MTDRDLAYTPAHQLVDMIARKRVSPVELTELYLRRIEDLDPGLNAFLTVTGDKAMATARLAEEAGKRWPRFTGTDITVRGHETSLLIH